MRLKVHKSERAQDDLLGIWLYGARRWGEEQADRYVDLIDASVRRLMLDQSAGTDFSHVRVGYRRLPVQRHRVFYVVEVDRVMIVRVLHERMDVVRQLRG